jgi:hypothetical protein
MLILKETRPLELVVYGELVDIPVDPGAPFPWTSPGNATIETITAWCKEQGIRRTSWNMWKFSSKEEMTMFILKWDGYAE